jgi:DNA invertase Pin-like site-specific DNA recombinase
MTRAIVYGRVSMIKQKQSGAGEMVQEDDCTDFITRLGYELVGPFLEDEAVSGSKSIEHRPALLEAIGSMKKGDVLVVAKRDRLGRDPMVIYAIEEEVKRKKCRILSAAGEGTADDSPESIFMRRIMDAAAEFERLRLIVRTKGAAAAKRRRGLVTGQLPYGWDPDPASPISESTGRPSGLMENAKEQRILATMERMRAGGVALRAIANDLNEMNVPTKRGLGSEGGRQWSGRWTHSAVDSILRNAPFWRQHVETQTQGEIEGAPVGVGDGPVGD